jgi:hypothetical protein
MDFFPVFLSLGVIVAGLHGLLARFPLSRADFTKDISVLESLDGSQNFINVSTNGSIVHGDMSEDTLIIDDVGSSEGDTSTGDEAAVGIGDVLGDIGNEGDLHFTETAFISGLLAPFSMGELGVDGDTEDFTVVLSEFFSLVGELEDFSGADEGEIEGIEEKDDVLSSVVGKLDLFEALAVDVGIGFEVRGFGEDSGDSGLNGVVDSGVIDGHLFIIQEFGSGGDDLRVLRQRIDQLS